MDITAAIWALVDAQGRLSCRVTPKARRPGVSLRDGVLRVGVSAAPENGKANAAVLAALAKALGVPRAALSIARGAKAREKVIQLSEEVLSGRRT